MTKTQVIDIIYKLGNITGGYFPTCDELNQATEDGDMSDFLFLILYFSTDPFKRLGLLNKDDKEYEETVEYAVSLAKEFPEELP